jgi:hypothetical protein
MCITMIPTYSFKVNKMLYEKINGYLKDGGSLSSSSNHIFMLLESVNNKLS